MSENSVAASPEHLLQPRKSALIALADGETGCFLLCLKTARLLLKEGVGIHILVGPSNNLGSVLALELLGSGVASGAAITFHSLDLDDSAQVDMFCQQTIPTLNIGYQVNIVGPKTSIPPSFLEMNRGNYHRGTGLWFLTQAVAKSMVGGSRNNGGTAAAPAGSIVNAASSCSFSSPTASSSHNEFHLFSQHLAMDLAGHGIRVNSVLPALVHTTECTNHWGMSQGPPASNEDKINTAKEMEAFLQSYAVVAFLLSERVGWLTAANSNFDGGVRVL